MPKVKINRRNKKPDPVARGSSRASASSIGKAIGDADDAEITAMISNSVEAYKKNKGDLKDVAKRVTTVEKAIVKADQRTDKIERKLDDHITIFERFEKITEKTLKAQATRIARSEDTIKRANLRFTAYGKEIDKRFADERKFLDDGLKKQSTRIGRLEHNLRSTNLRINRLVRNMEEDAAERKLLAMRQQRLELAHAAQKNVQQNQKEESKGGWDGIDFSVLAEGYGAKKLFQKRFNRNAKAPEIKAPRSGGIMSKFGRFAKGAAGSIGEGILGGALIAGGDWALDKVFGTPEKAYEADVKKYGKAKADELYKVRTGNAISRSSDLYNRTMGDDDEKKDDKNDGNVSIDTTKDIEWKTRSSISLEADRDINIESKNGIITFKARSIILDGDVEFKGKAGKKGTAATSQTGGDQGPPPNPRSNIGDQPPELNRTENTTRAGPYAAQRQQDISAATGFPKLPGQMGGRPGTSGGGVSIPSQMRSKTGATSSNGFGGIASQLAQLQPSTPFSGGSGSFGDIANQLAQRQNAVPNSSRLTNTDVIPTNGAAKAANAITQAQQGTGSAAALDLALQERGLHERKDRETISQYLKNGGVNLDPATTAWCAAFVNSTLKQSGMNGTGSQAAGSFQKWGAASDVEHIKKGDILVNKTPSPRTGMIGSHVGFATGDVQRDKNGNITGVKMVSGNSNDAVSETWERPGSWNVRTATEREDPNMATRVASSGSVTDKMSGAPSSSALAEERAAVMDHLDKNPALKEKLFAVATNEQSMHPQGVQGVMEETINRSIIRGGGVEGGIKRLEKEIRFTSEGGYYEDSKGSAARARARAADPNNQKFFNNAFEKVRNGSDVSGNAYGNASGATAENKITGANGITATPTKSINGETFFGPNSDEPGYIKNYNERNARLAKRTAELKGDMSGEPTAQSPNKNTTQRDADLKASSGVTSNTPDYSKAYTDVKTPGKPAGYSVTGGQLASRIDENGKLSSLATSFGRSRIISGFGDNFSKLPAKIQDHLQNASQLDMKLLAPYAKHMPAEMRQGFEENGLKFSDATPETTKRVPLPQTFDAPAEKTASTSPASDKSDFATAADKLASRSSEPAVPYKSDDNSGAVPADITATTPTPPKLEGNNVPESETPPPVPETNKSDKSDGGEDVKPNIGATPQPAPASSGGEGEQNNQVPKPTNDAEAAPPTPGSDGYGSGKQDPDGQCYLCAP